MAEMRRTIESERSPLGYPPNEIADRGEASNPGFRRKAVGASRRRQREKVRNSGGMGSLED